MSERTIEERIKKLERAAQMTAFYTTVIAWHVGLRLLYDEEGCIVLNTEGLEIASVAFPSASSHVYRRDGTDRPQGEII